MPGNNLLRLHHIVPEPLAGRMDTLSHSDIWDKDVTFESGGRLLLRAASGKGKSTLIHILYGLRRDYSGEAEWRGKRLREKTDEDWASTRSGALSIVFQDLRLFPELTVAENLSIKQVLTGAVSLEEARDWVDELGLHEKWEQKAATLSYGERQRVAIVRSLLQPFSWLLLDEPFSHLDNANAQKAATLIRRRTEQTGAGIIVVDLEDNDLFPYTQKMLL